MPKSEEKPTEEIVEAPAAGLFVPNIPMPVTAEESKEIIKDQCEVAFKIAFVGAGQAGARMVEAFYKLGYRRVCAVNTTSQDLVAIDIPDENKFVMDIGEGGAGKEPEKGEQAVKKHYENVYDLMRRSFGKDFERIIVCIGAGGGTGSGSIETLIDIAHDIAESFKLEGGPEQVPAVGALVSMPMSNESQKVNANASKVLEVLFGRVGKDKGGRLSQRTMSPLIVVDNDRISKLYPGLPVTQFWSVANQSISGLFHLFNNIAAAKGENTIATFDRADFADVLKSGVITFGATPLIKWQNETDISFAIRENLKHNILVADIDLGSAAVAAGVVIGKDKILNSVPQDYLNHGFEMLGRIMKTNSVVHRGIYKLGEAMDNVKEQPDLVVYTAFGELGKPDARMEEIQRLGAVDQQNRMRLR